MSFFVLLGLSRGFSRFVRGLSGDFPDWSFSSFSAYYQHLRGTVPKGSVTQPGPFPKKVGNTRVWKPPGLASPKIGVSMSSLFVGTDSVSVRKMPLKPQEWLQKWAFRAFQTRSLSGWDLYGPKLKGIFTSENQGNALRQDFAYSWSVRTGRL